jgi:phospholipid/cholesterol/gamma-HCH transport system permease protein
MGAEAQVTVSRLPDRTVRVELAGRWRMGRGLPASAAVIKAIDDPPGATRAVLVATGVTAWDSSLVALIERVLAHCRQLGIAADTSALPEGLRRLLSLAEATPAQAPPPPPAPLPWLARIGVRASDAWQAFLRLNAFTGEVAFSLARLFTGRARVRGVDLLGELESAGAGALTIVAVVSVLLGAIVAFVADVTLGRFAARLYIADAVAIGMVRELGPMMTAIVMTGRSGSAYAAQLGTMKVGYEIDALTTMPLPPIDFLVLPRVVALTLMIPLLAIYADFIGIVAGGVVAVAGGSNAAQYAHEVRTALGLTMFWLGLIKSTVFGAVVAICGCMQGMQAEKGAAAVGEAATRTVVASIVWIIAIDGVFAVIFKVLRI